MKRFMSRAFPLTFLFLVLGCADAPENLEDPQDTAQVRREPAGQAAEKAREADRSVKEDVQELGEDARETARDVGDATRETARDVGDAVEEGLEDVGGALENTADTLRSTTSDLRLAAAVKLAIAEDDRLDARLIAVSVQDGVVTLRGKVGSMGLRLHATNVATDIEGVRRVENELDVGD